MGRRTSRRGELGDHIAQARHTAGVTQAELAGKVGVSARQVNRWESGATVPQRRHAELIAKALGIDYAPLRDLIDDARSEQYDEATAERDAAAKERDRLFEKVEELTRVVAALVAQLEQQAANGRR